MLLALWLSTVLCVARNRHITIADEPIKECMTLSVGLRARRELRNKTTPVDTFERIHFNMSFLPGYSAGASHPLDHSEPTLALLSLSCMFCSLRSSRAHWTEHAKYVDTERNLHVKKVFAYDGITAAPSTIDDHLHYCRQAQRLFTHMTLINTRLTWKKVQYQHLLFLHMLWDEWPWSILQAKEYTRSCPQGHGKYLSTHT